MTKIKFNKHNVTNGTTKARCHYSHSMHYGMPGEQREAIVIYAKDYNSGLGRMFDDEYKNETDSMTDYFEKGRVVLRPEHPLFSAAMERVQK